MEPIQKEGRVMRDSEAEVQVRVAMSAREKKIRRIGWLDAVIAGMKRERDTLILSLQDDPSAQWTEEAEEDEAWHI